MPIPGRTTVVISVGLLLETFYGEMNVWRESVLYVMRGLSRVIVRFGASSGAMQRDRREAISVAQ